eukprot:CAMPEP_0178503322 /NCGR_PEP_ID=MMETSP0696-20121128/17980_1 /TAXON_ID=265572 /ORGANISM="Extubocellulus spinifer, Strain CCMP396" /LENGTH=284 /DNA_ID=CAMNT_0020132447 /DNA_START=46 /DNA_END=900 /DNA_ORIENTATION=+
MTTYTPQDKQEDVSASAFLHGAFYGAMALVPSTLVVGGLMKTSPRFLKATNFQSRTALAIMPPLFVFGLTSEKKLEHDMKQMAAEGTDAWVKQQEAEQHKKLKDSIHSLSAEQAEMMELYKDEVEHSGVRIVPGDTLSIPQRVANYWQANPFKILAAIGIPGVFYIFKGKAGQEHLQLQSKIMHTRVYGQFAVIGMLLSLMGFKQYMDTEGTFITEREAQEKVEAMAIKREQLLKRIEFNKKLDEDRRELIRKAHDDDVAHNLQAKVARNDDVTHNLQAKVAHA